ncbi:MAG TPA: hypothetical protein VHH55_06730 [Gaiellaceae bacterium]|jgi:hypothetical protein|nr:hypothetical protein [Gaiellaceae bacterium]
METPASRRRVLRFVAAVGAVVALTLVSVPAAGTTGIGNGLLSYVRVTKTGPLPSCAQDGSTCTAANTFHWFVYVLNANRVGEATGRGLNRATLPNSFVVESVSYRVFVDGVERPELAFTFTPPPHPSYRPWSGHWPATATCGAPGEPCNLIGPPAILAGENTVALYGGWTHGSEEPDGSYVFRFAIRGTLEGTPVELQASSPPITMTP